ncbi:MAG: hypothetical protein WAW59_05555 [Patescibacteria group bacterium]
MNNLQEEVLTSIQILTNTNTKEIHHETIFDAVSRTLDNKISETDFKNFFRDKTGALDTPFSNSFIEEIYKEYSWLYDYLYVNRSKLK